MQVRCVRGGAGGPEREPPGASEEPFFRAFSTQDKNEVTFFSELVSGSLFETFCRLFLEILGGQKPAERSFELKQ